MQPCKQTLLLQDTLALVDRNRVPRIALSGKGNNYGVSWGCVINKAHFVEEDAPDFYILRIASTVMVNWFYYGNARSNKKTRTDKFGGRFTAS